MMQRRSEPDLGLRISVWDAGVRKRNGQTGRNGSASSRLNVSQSSDWCGLLQGRMIQFSKMTVIQELDRYMYEITHNAPPEQAEQLNDLITSTKPTFNRLVRVKPFDFGSRMLCLWIVS